MPREKLKVEAPLRVSVPMRDTVAEQPVVVMKVRNGTGAKGLHCLVLLNGQPYMGGTIE